MAQTAREAEQTAADARRLVEQVTADVRRLVEQVTADAPKEIAQLSADARKTIDQAAADARKVGREVAEEIEVEIARRAADREPHGHLATTSYSQTGRSSDSPASGSQNLPSETGDQAQQSMFRDIDTILARLENGITVERAAMHALLDRLSENADDPSKQVGPIRYTVKEGDTIAALANRYYGDASEPSRRRIYDANKEVIRRDEPKPGETLIIPPRKVGA